MEIKKTAEFLKTNTNFNPKIGVILGTGLGGLVDEIDIKFSFSYDEIPNFPISTVEGHSGKLIFGCREGFIIMKAITCKKLFFLSE